MSITKPKYRVKRNSEISGCEAIQGHFSFGPQRCGEATQILVEFEESPEEWFAICPRDLDGLR